MPGLDLAAAHQRVLELRRCLGDIAGVAGLRGAHQQFHGVLDGGGLPDLAPSALHELARVAERAELFTALEAEDPCQRSFPVGDHGDSQRGAGAGGSGRPT